MEQSGFMSAEMRVRTRDGYGRPPPPPISPSPPGPWPGGKECLRDPLLELDYSQSLRLRIAAHLLTDQVFSFCLTIDYLLTYYI